MSEDGERAGDGVGATEPRSVRERVATRRLTAARSLAVRFGVGPTTVQLLLGIVLVGLLARLLWLGARGAHYDEGRVAYWTLRSLETGHFEYRSIIHGPLVQHVDRWLFALVGPSDVVARLPVALVGAALPLVVLWFRDHLSEVELLAMAALLAANPILLYYSRFLRSDLLVATFMLAALGALLRLRATRRPRYLYAAAGLAALGFASKENAVVYVLCWLGAAVLVYEPFLSRPAGHPTGVALMRDRARGLRARIAADGRPGPGRWAGHLAGSAGLFVLLTLLLFAPRAGGGGPDLWRVLGDPLHLPVVVRATAVDLAYGYGSWFGGAADPGCNEETLPEGYACYLWRMTTTIAQFATATAALAAVGFLRERYAVERSRPIVAFATFWGVASVVGYPLGTDIWAAWIVSHVVVPLTIPAAVGAGVLVRLAGDGIAADREALVAVPVAILLVLGAWTGYVAVETSYVDDSTRDHAADMVQYAQPERGITPAVAAMERAVADRRGGDPAAVRDGESSAGRGGGSSGGQDGGPPDVLYHGERFHLADESVADRPPVPANSSAWFRRLPLPWYTESMGAEVASTATETALARHLEGRPPVVVATASQAESVAGKVEGYRTFAFDTRAHVDGPGEATSVVVFVDEARLDDPGPTTGT